MVAIFENENAQSIVGSQDAPYLTSLARTGTTFTDAHAEAHPSQPNYLALFSGSTQGVKDDACPQTFSGPNLAAQLKDAGRTFAGYSEDLPSVGYTGCNAGGYARKHSPWVDFTGVPGSVNQPYTALPADFSRLPTVSFVVPNLCNDMHDCGVATGDAWLSHAVPEILRSRAFASGRSLLVVTFDEGVRADNRIATVLAGPAARPRARSARAYTHYSLLRTIEDAWRLAPLATGDAAAVPMTDLLR
jgi:acid phosphatase